jgi:hypothetical protein
VRPARLAERAAHAADAVPGPPGAAVSVRPAFGARWLAGVVERPVVALAGTVLVLLALAVPALRLSLALPVPALRLSLALPDNGPVPELRQPDVGKREKKLWKRGRPYPELGKSPGSIG